MTPATATVSPVQEFLDRYEHDAEAFVREVLGVTPYPWQSKVLGRISQGARRISIRSGHRVGKSALVAWVICWWITTRFPQKTAATAATSQQLFDALVPETKTWLARLPEAWKDVFTAQAESIFHTMAPDESFVTFKTSKAETPEAMAGAHSAHTLLIADEASGIPDEVYVAAQSSMAAPDSLMILTGNPVRLTGYFYESQTVFSHLWETFTVSGEDNPNVDQQYVSDMREQYGEDSNTYRVRVLGEFPLADDNAVIPFDLTEAALTRDVVASPVQPIWGVDCARYGRDRSAVAKRKGNVLMEPVVTYNGLDTMQLVGRIMDQWNHTPPHNRPSEICVDVIGIGAGVTDRLAELGLPARGVNVSESPAMGARYTNLKAELWFLCREWFETRACNIANDKDLRDELIQVDYDFSSSGRIQIKSKKSLAAKGVRSPDLAEAFVMTFAGVAISATHGSKGAISWKTPLRRVLKSLV